MNEMTVKICGLKREADVQLCMDLGVDILGFVTEYPVPVPWNLSRGEAANLINKVQAPHRSCVVTGGTAEKVIELAACLRPSMVQLHYNETLQDTIKIADALRELHIAVIKTIPVGLEERIFQFGTAKIETIVAELCQSSLYGLLVDSRGPANASESSARLDLDFCREIIKLSAKPVLIAGGIHADNVRYTVARTGAQFIDIMSGVESSPGQKDAVLLERLLTSVRNLYL